MSSRYQCKEHSDHNHGTEFRLRQEWVPNLFRYADTVLLSRRVHQLFFQTLFTGLRQATAKLAEGL